jgi:hypothetical protein
MTPRLQAESTGVSDIVWKMNYRRVELRELLRKTNDEKFSFGRIECEKICRHPVGNV